MSRTIAHYRIEEEIGRGGMGVVYRALDLRLGRAVALKILPPDRVQSADARQRFVQEARAASGLNHPNIVTIFEIGEDEGTTFIAMELVEGKPLDGVLAAGALPVATALGYAVQASAALASAHARGIVHRDIKPANIVIGDDGRVKILDFGLAKLVERSASEVTITAMATSPGTILGTLAYMAPEQAEGHVVDARADIFSLGAVLYEMLAGRRPFAGSSDMGLLTAILRDNPPPLDTVRRDVPAEVIAIVQRALQKDPGARFQTAAEMRDALTGVHSAAVGRQRRPETAKRGPWLAAAIAAVIAVGAVAGWQIYGGQRARWAREAVPEIERLAASEQSLAAVRLARDAERYAPEVARVRDTWLPLDITTDPDGVEIELRNYLDERGPWEYFGVTPIHGLPLPQGYYRLRARKEGYEPIDVGYLPGRPPLKLTRVGEGQPGMVFVPTGTYAIGVAPPVQLPDFWIDKFEVTNRDFKRFVDAGGYRNTKYWRQPFHFAGRVLPFDEAMERFRDSTGRPGPSTWEIGSYSPGQDDVPVGGVSWYEALAYAEFAGRTLPSLYHWYYASGVDEIFTDVLRVSNFDGKGPVRAGQLPGLGPWGTYDMAGNVKEWCFNEAGTTGRRYILGGGWTEPAYRYREAEARDPWDRDAAFGFRLIKETAPAPHAMSAVAHLYGDPESLHPVDDEQFALLRRFYAYEPMPLDARIEAVDDGSPYWKKETVSFTGPSGADRIPAFLFVPKNAQPPYQTIVFFPSSYAREFPSSRMLDIVQFEFIVRSGRAVLYPVYDDTYERRQPLTRTRPGVIRDRNLLWTKEIFRAVDYVTSRPDVDATRIGYYSFSLGAFLAPIPLALEPRFKAAVLASGGLRFDLPPEIQTSNFMPRVRTPVLLVNGKDDFAVPPAAQQKFYDLLGTAPADKKLVSLDGGHMPSDTHAFYREVLDWFDAYLGRVR